MMRTFALYVCVFAILGPLNVSAVSLVEQMPFPQIEKEEDPESFEHKMLMNLTHWENYKRYIPPDNGDVEDGQNIEFRPSLGLIEELDEKKQQLTALMYIHMKWKDLRLAWNTSDYGGIKYLITQDRRVWSPEIILGNQVTYVRDYNYPTLVLVSGGSVMYQQRKRYQTTCPLNFRKFPFDEQKCDFWWIQRNVMSRYKTQMNFTIVPDHVERSFSGMVEHQAWEVVGASAKAYRRRSGNQTSQVLLYSYNLKRRGHYYSYMFVSPAVMLALLIPVLFLMPTEGTVRFTLGGAMLVSIFILLLMLEEELPITHTSVPALGLYYTVTFVLVTLSLVLGTLTHNIATKSVRLSHPPYILKQMLLTCVARVLCVPYSSKYGVGTTDVALEETDKQGLVETDPQLEWKLMAMVLDRILFLIFLIVVIITSLALLA